MEDRRSIQMVGGGGLPDDRFQGITTSLKVAGLAAAYAAFVWLTMFQLERGYLALHEVSPRTEVSAESDRREVVASGDTGLAVKASAVAQTATGPTRLPSDTRTGVVPVERF